MTKILKMLPALLLALGSASHASADTDWSLNVTFSDGAVAKGTFITNTAGTALKSWNIQVTGGLAVHDFSSQSSNGVSTSLNFGQIATNPSVYWPTGTVEALEFADFVGIGEYSVFYLGNMLTGDPITIVNALDCGGGSSCGVFKSGSITDPPLPSVPEPVSIFLLGSGVVFISLAMRRRSKKL